MLWLADAKVLNFVTFSLSFGFFFAPTLSAPPDSAPISDHLFHAKSIYIGLRYGKSHFQVFFLPFSEQVVWDRVCLVPKFLGRLYDHLSESA
jgi:hypothetical protein